MSNICSLDADLRMKQLEQPVVIKNNISVIKYYRSGLEMVRQAEIYKAEGKLEQAYTLCFRFVQLFVQDIRKHPEYGNTPKEEKVQITKQIRNMMDLAESLKLMLKEKFQNEHVQWLKQKAAEPSAPPISNLPSRAPSPPPSSNPFFKSGLRRVLIPKSLIPNFIRLSKQNTDRNIETCGLLSGTLEQDNLKITVLLIPEQTGSSDNCTAENDLATFNEIDKRGLLTLGWIHTHPTQDAFLSSIDAHSQHGYQSMMPEAVAIVCASRNCNEVFRLTDMGMEKVSQCTERGFHPHSGPPLFEHCAHVQFTDSPCEVVDLR